MFLEFSGFYILSNLQLSRFFVVVCLSSNFDSLSYLQLFVNNFFISFLLSVSAATFIYYHICYCLSTTFLTHFSELSHRFSRWTFNISLLSQLVKGICAIFLYNFQLYFPTTKCAYFFCISLYFVVNKKGSILNVGVCWKAHFQHSFRCNKIHL